MDIYTFITKLVESLAWPISVIAILILLRNPIYQLIPLIRKFRYKEFEFEFSEKLNEIKQESKEMAIENFEESKNERLEKYLSLLEISPKSAIVEAWSNLEKALIECGIRNGLVKEMNSSKSITGRAILLQEKGIISENQLKMFSSLQTLRSRAIHNEETFEVSTQNAKEYVGTALLLALNLNKQ